MDKNTGRISFKAFWDAVEQRLAAYSADELRAILRAMAQETPPSGRQAFLEKLKPSETGMEAPEPAPQEDLLADIDDWIEELRAEMEDAEDYEDRHGYDWGALLMLDDDRLIAPIVTKYQQSPPQYKRLLKDLRHALQVDWIGENLLEAVDGS